MSAEEKTPDWLVPNYPPLKCDDPAGQAAVEGQIQFYPRVVRTMVDPPVMGQRLGLVSFVLFKESRKLSNGKPVYGYVKFRGAYADKSQAKFEASKIIREVDSRYPVRIAPMGAWVPITDEEAFTKEHVDVRMTEDEKHLRDEAVKEKEAEQRRISREIREREEEVKSGDIYDDPESLTYYSMRRVTEVRLLEYRDKYLQQIENITKSLRQVQKETKNLEVKYPDYKERWIDCYNEERRKAGIPDYVPSEEQMAEHENATLETDEDANSSAASSSEADI